MKTNKEARLFALLEAHEHLSEHIGHKRTGMKDGSKYEEGELSGLEEVQERVREVIVDTAME